jgi:glycosyltransferase involved in cell wall biosynthesis
MSAPAPKEPEAQGGAIPGLRRNSAGPGRSIVLLVTNILPPYRIPLLNELTRQLQASGYVLKVAFAAAAEKRRLWVVEYGNCNFDFEILGGHGFTRPGSESPIFLYPRLLALVCRDRPVAIVVGGFGIATFKLWWRSFFRYTPYIIWSGATSVSTHPWRAGIRDFVRRRFFARASAFVVHGSLARNYVCDLGAASRRVHLAINTVDVEYFSRETAKRRRPGFGAEFLYVGHLTGRKRVDRLIHAFATVARERADATLVIVGDGPMQSQLSALVCDLGLDSRVRFEGFRCMDELPAFFATALCLVFPTSYDLWGRVISEAMAAGLPCVVSVRAGAAHDLIEDGVTGFIVDFANCDDVARKMLFLADHPAEAARMGEAAGNFMQANATMASAARGFVDAIAASVGRYSN